LILKPANNPNARKRVPFGAADEVRALGFGLFEFHPFA